MAEAWRAAKIRVRFARAEAEGLVRFRVESDNEPYQMGDAEDEAETRLRIRDESLWGIVSEYLCPCCGSWAFANSVSGFIGQDWRDSGYDDDVKLAALEQRAEVAARLEGMERTLRALEAVERAS